MCELHMKRKMFKMRQASRQVHEDKISRVVYEMGGKVASMKLDLYRDAGLDALGATRICVITSHR